MVQVRVYASNFEKFVVLFLSVSNNSSLHVQIIRINVSYVFFVEQFLRLKTVAKLSDLASIKTNEYIFVSLSGDMQLSLIKTIKNVS